MSHNYLVAALQRYPVKGFQPEYLTKTPLSAGALLPGDRMWGFTSGHGATKGVATDEWMKKSHFLQLMQYAELTKLAITFAADGKTASLHHNKACILTGDLSVSEIAEEFCRTLQQILGAAGARLPGQIGLRQLVKGGFSDTKAPWISIAGIASLQDICAAAALAPNGALDNAANRDRFRINVWLETDTPFEELQWAGRKARLGSAIIRFMEPVRRCAAIDVDPDTGQRAKDLPGWMRRHYGHDAFGIFAIVETSGVVSTADQLVWL